LTGLPPLLGSAVIPPAFGHGFTTRAGGVSAPPFDSLNLGVKWGDARADVMENRARLLRASGARVMHLAAQVHGARVLAVQAADDPEETARQPADAVCTDVPGLAVGVYVADCVPVVLVDPRTGACAAAHAGWRGTVGGVLDETVRALARHYGSRPGDLRAALGPAIGPCCFEVGPEVAAQFQALLPDEPGVVRERPGTRPHIDLRLAQRRQCERAGLDPQAIDLVPGCTRCDAARFFSYRRDAGRTGIHVGFVTRR
jgi:YfiH family protein